MSIPDPLHFTETEWNEVLIRIPERAQRGFTAHRLMSKLRARHLLKSYENKEGGLTTYDPIRVSGVVISEEGLNHLGELIERCDLEAQIRRYGVVEAHRKIAES